MAFDETPNERTIMPKDEIIVGAVVGVTVGVIAAYVGNSTIRRIQDQIHKEEIREAETEGFKRGYDTLASNPGRMRQMLDKLNGAA